MNIAYDVDQLAALCRRYHVAKLEVFGSQARGEARPDSDVDVLVTFEENHRPGWNFFAFADELEKVFNCSVDLLTRQRVERDDNPYFRSSVLSRVEHLYAA